MSMTHFSIVVELYINLSYPDHNLIAAMAQFVDQTSSDQRTGSLTPVVGVSKSPLAKSKI